MNYIITVKKTKERHDNVVLDNETKVEQKIEWKGQIYLVKEIIINPVDEVIELKCWNVSNVGKEKSITVTVR